MSDSTEDNPKAISLVSNKELSLSAKERQNILTLIVEEDEIEATSLKESMQELGYKTPHVEHSFSSALKVLMDRHFTHLLFTATANDMTAEQFLQAAVKADTSLVAIPTSKDPKIDDIFSLLQNGARWFMVSPYTTETIDEAVIQATKGEAFSESLLFAEDRNAAFSALISANLDSAADAYRDAGSHLHGEEEKAEALKKLHASTKLAKVFSADSKDGGNQLASSIVDFFSSLAQGPASRLGRLRKRLNSKRKKR